MTDNNENKVLNVPHLRFPEFSGEWKMATFGDIAKGFDYGMNAAAKSFDGNNKYIRITDIDEVSSQYLYDDVVSPDGELEDRYLVKENDILLARTGASTGKSYLYRNSDGKLYFAGFLIRANIYKHNSYFVFSQLHTLRYKKWISVMSARSGQPGINSQEYASFPVYTTSLQEEDKIATFLKLLDERIITQNKIIEKLQSLIKGLNDNIHKGIKGETVCFSDLGEAYSGLSGKGGDDFGYGEPFITYMNVYQNTYISEKDYELVQIAPNEKQNSVQYGDALFTLSSETPEEVGIGAVYLGNTQKLYLNSFCFGIHFYDERVLPQYLAHFISSSSFRRAIYPLAQGSTRFNLQKNDFMKMKFLLPSLEKQGHIANTLDALHCRLANEKSLTEQYILLKKYLLSLMFI